MKALVLGGGGSKGSYEVGAWKALDELGLSFDLVCGTSIGAMIGALYVQQDYRKAYDVWNQLHVDDVMAHGMNFDFDLELMMSQKDKIKPFLKHFMRHKGADISPFIHLVEDLFDETKFFASSIDFGCMTYNVSKLMPQAVRKADMNMLNAKDYIIASASCYPAFPMKMIHDEKYIDGGYADNVPIQLAREMGADEIVAIDLKSIGRLVVQEPQAGLTYIEPMVGLGSFMLFEHDQIMRNMKLGYNDVMKKFHHYAGGIYTFHKKDMPQIKQLSNYLEKHLSNFQQTLSGHMMNGKIAAKQLSHVLKTYQLYDDPYLAMLEQAALTYNINIIEVYDMIEFVTQVCMTARQHANPFMCIWEDKDNLKNAFLALKEAPAIDIISFQYACLLKNDENNVWLHTQLVMGHESFIKAYALYIVSCMYSIAL